jgi:hypothetical protein
MRLKASSFRSYVGIVERQGRRDAVLALVPPDTGELMKSPPLPGSWMDLRHILDVIQAVETVGGMTAVLDLARQGTEDARRAYMVIVDGVLRLFGTSPATLFKRMNTLVASFIEGIDYRYTATGERSGVMEVEYRCGFEIPMCVFVGSISVFQTLIHSCGCEGVIGQPERLSATTARFQIRW